jgi:hypothetical protein
MLPRRAGPVQPRHLGCGRRHRGRPRVSGR